MGMTAASERRLPWYIWCAVLAVTSVMIGAHWDISWHSSIGRDSFWTPAHIAIYMCGVLAGIAFGYLIISTTFNSRSELRDASVRIWGFRGPLGAFIASWGGVAMLTSAPFDNWWHSAYGLDVRILSPPHVLLFLGGFAVLFGTMVLISGYANRADQSGQEMSRRVFLYVSAVALIMLMVLIEEYTTRPFLHSSPAYLAVCILAPMVLGTARAGSGGRFSATTVTAIYTGVIIGFILVLPLFPAQPKLGPVFQHVTQFIPPQFPILLIVPGLALDLVWARLRLSNTWAVAAVSAIVFLTVLIAAEWPFATFLQSSAAQNRFFGTGYMYYGTPPSSYLARHLFWQESAAQFWQGMAMAVVFAFLSFALGISRGKWMRDIQR
jgi:uncharacterized membrane protein